MVRKDYKHLLVDAGRHKEDGLKHKVRKDDRLSTKAPTRNYMHRYWSPRDYASPLYRCLRRNVNRPWDKVYSELCQNASAKSLLGQHLRQHIWDIVVPNDRVIKTKGGYRQFPYRHWVHRSDNDGLMLFKPQELYIDDQGILRAPRKKEIGKFGWKSPDREKFFKRLTDTSAHIYFSGCWWYVEWQNYKIGSDEKDPRNMPWLRTKKYLEYNHRTGTYELTAIEGCKRDLKWIYSSGDRWHGFHTVIFPTVKRQLSKRDMKNHGLAA